MTIDFSLLNNIDFKNPENIIFLVIILVIVCIVLFIIFIVLYKIFKSVKTFFTRFKLNQSKQNVIGVDKGDDLNIVVKELEKSKIERAIIQDQRMATATTSGPMTGADKDVVKKDDSKSFKEAEQKKIEEGLGRIKAGGPGEEDTLESKMPSRSNQEEDKFKEIKIPVSKRAEVITNAPNRTLETSHLPEKNYINPTNNVSGPKVVPGDTNKSNIPAGLFKKEQAINQKNPFEKPDFMKNNLAPKSQKDVHGRIVRGTMGKEDSSIFGGKAEVSRTELEKDMESDPTVWKVAGQSGLAMTPIERSKLVKEVFSSAYGRNISKNDLKSGIAKLGRKMLDTKDIKEHAKIRKEIKFLKKIGGIKG